MNIRKIGATLFVVTIIFIPVRINAGRGCCSHHGGTAGCTASGRQICGDGSLSPTCGCTPPTVYGCTDSSASNYNSSANQDDGSCVYYIHGCTDTNAINYNASANQDNGSCIYAVKGCTDSTANNYDPLANENDGSCIYMISGCTDVSAENYNPNANQDDGSCKYKIIEKDPSENITNKTKDSNNKNETESNEESDPLSTVIGLGTIAGGAYVYKKIKK